MDSKIFLHILVEYHFKFSVDLIQALDCGDEKYFRENGCSVISRLGVEKYLKCKLNYSSFVTL